MHEQEKSLAIIKVKTHKIIFVCSLSHILLISWQKSKKNARGLLSLNSHKLISATLQAFLKRDSLFYKPLIVI